VDLRLLQRVDRVDLSGARPRGDVDGRRGRSAGLLIGADGLHSPVRAALNGQGRARSSPIRWPGAR
jgi:salicylate hydroxylase